MSARDLDPGRGPARTGRVSRRRCAGRALRRASKPSQTTRGPRERASPFRRQAFHVKHARRFGFPQPITRPTPTTWLSMSTRRTGYLAGRSAHTMSDRGGLIRGVACHEGYGPRHFSHSPLPTASRPRSLRGRGERDCTPNDRELNARRMNKPAGRANSRRRRTCLARSHHSPPPITTHPSWLRTGAAAGPRANALSHRGLAPPPLRSCTHMAGEEADPQSRTRSTRTMTDVHRDR